MFERFTDRARKVVTLAQEESRGLSHNYIGTEHLLLGIMREAGGIGAKVLGEYDITYEGVRERVLQTIGPGATKPKGHIPLTPRAKSVIERALKASGKLGHNYIGTEHLLLGLLDAKDGVAAKILVEHGLTRSDVEQRVVAWLGSMGAKASGGETVPFRRSKRGRRGAQQALGPGCPSCEAPLSETARYSMMDVQRDDGEGAAQVMFLYCSSCGLTIDDVILPGE